MFDSCHVLFRVRYYRSCCCSLKISTHVYTLNLTVLLAPSSVICTWVHNFWDFFFLILNHKIGSLNELTSWGFCGIPNCGQFNSIWCGDTLRVNVSGQLNHIKIHTLLKAPWIPIGWDTQVVHTLGWPYEVPEAFKTGISKVLATKVVYWTGWGQVTVWKPAHL